MSSERAPFSDRSTVHKTVAVSLTANTNDFGALISELQDYSADLSIFISSTGAPWTISGLSLGQTRTRSRRVSLCCLTGSLALPVESGLSLAANRIAANTGMGTTATITLGSVTLVYDLVALRWRIVGGTAGASVIYV